MALLTDDMDIRTVYLRMDFGCNGDYYLQTIKEGDKGTRELHSVRISTSGGNAPTSVKIAVAELYRALEEHGLNEFPK